LSPAASAPTRGPTGPWGSRLTGVVVTAALDDGVRAASTGNQQEEGQRSVERAVDVTPKVHEDVSSFPKWHRSAILDLRPFSR
jgi:hypothetical protein